MNEENVLKADAVFEGGGVKGIGLVGAVAVAEAKGYRWNNLAGTSAGAIVAALLAAGYTALELKAVMEELDYNRFKDAGTLDKVPLAGPLASLICEKGIYEGQYLKQWIRGLLQQKGIKTFGDLITEEPGNNKPPRFKLRLIASDISRGRMLVLPQDIAGFGMRPEDLDVADAVRMSMSIPFFYEPIKRRNKQTGQASYIVDGGLLSNFPV
ncbi:patatin-like phospholipase family protein [Chloroflexota bacterium]